MPSSLPEPPRNESLLLNQVNQGRGLPNGSNNNGNHDNTASGTIKSANNGSSIGNPIKRQHSIRNGSIVRPQGGLNNNAMKTTTPKPSFISKKQREEMRRERLRQLQEELEREESSQGKGNAEKNATTTTTAQQNATKQQTLLTDAELQDLKKSYIHNSSSSAATATSQNSSSQKPASQMRRHSKKVYEDWDPSDDTSAINDVNPLFQRAPKVAPLFGRGKRGGETLHEDKEKRSVPWYKKAPSEMTRRDWRIFKEEFEIRTKGRDVPNPIRSWKEASIPDPLRRAIREAGYRKPTPIQMQCVPLAFSKRDVLGVAETGSGKTAAFVVPMLSQVAKMPRLSQENARRGPYALVLAPTRELVQQIASETQKLARHMDIRVMFVIGGESIQDQQLQFSQGVEVLIATPGRLVDLLENRYMSLNQCTYMVLDEADRMCSMNYEDDLLFILKCMPKGEHKTKNSTEASSGTVSQQQSTRQHQTVMFSATMPASVEKLAHEYLTDRILVSIGELGRVNENIELITHWVQEQDKKNHLKKVLYRATPPVIIFANERRAVDAVTQFLKSLRFNVAGIHGGKPQATRESIIDGFRTGYYDYLVATDLAGRGIDIEGITLVVNYDVPDDISKFKHRVGRTGRAGAKGRAISLLTEKDTKIMYDLKRLLRASNAHIPHELAIADASRTTEQVKQKAERNDRKNHHHHRR